MGKPVDDALAVDVAATVRCMNWTGEAIDKVYDQVAPTGHDELGLVTHEPLGVVAAIVPWNFPMLMAAWKIAPALAMGNSVLLKPSEKSPLTAIRLAELAIEAGIPAGRVQRAARLRQGRGRAAGPAHGRGRTGVHRLDRGRQAPDAMRRPFQPQARLHGVRRQEPEHRLRRRPGPGRGRGGRGERHLLQPGRGLHRRVAPAGRALDQGRVPRPRGRGGTRDAAAPSASSPGRRWARWWTGARCSGCSTTSAPATPRAQD